jgi:hypothetical protein
VGEHVFVVVGFLGHLERGPMLLDFMVHNICFFVDADVVLFFEFFLRILFVNPTEIVLVCRLPLGKVVVFMNL